MARAFPMVDHIASRTAGRPQIAELGLRVAGSQVADRSFVDLNVAAGADFLADNLVNGPQPDWRFHRKRHGKRRLTVSVN